MTAFRTMLGSSTKGSDMLAYLSMMAPRLVELRRVLRPTGALYLHCDPTASHYLKLLLDAIFGVSNFRNEIIWHYGGLGAKASANCSKNTANRTCLCSCSRHTSGQRQRNACRNHGTEDLRARALRPAYGRASCGKPG